jgi:hypothetical protein
VSDLQSVPVPRDMLRRLQRYATRSWTVQLDDAALADRDAVAALLAAVPVATDDRKTCGICGMSEEKHDGALHDVAPGQRVAHGPDSVTLEITPRVSADEPAETGD